MLTIHSLYKNVSSMNVNLLQIVRLSLLVLYDNLPVIVVNKFIPFSINWNSLKIIVR